MFVDTYKAVIIRNMTPKRPSSHANNSSNYGSPMRRHFISRKIQTSTHKRPTRPQNVSEQYNKPRNIEDSQERRKIYQAEY